MLAFERKYGLLSETFFAAYMSGEEPEDDDWVLDFGEWASAYRMLLRRKGEYRNALQRIHNRTEPSIIGLVRVAT